MTDARRGRGRRGPAAEDRFRVRATRGARFLTSRQEHDGLTVVVKRFPSRSGAAGGGVPAFVLVHGLGVSSRYFHPVAAELARSGGVLVLDLPGYGASPGPRRRVGLEDHARVVAGVLEHAVAETPSAPAPVLVGHSMGAQVAAIVAQRRPELLDRVVLMAPTMAPRWRGFWRAAGRLLTDALREPPVVFGIALVDYLVRCGPPYLLRQSAVMLADDLEERMPEIASRVLVLCSDRDAIVPVEWGRRLAELAPRGRYLEVGGPHVVMHTDPQIVARAITAQEEAP